MEIDNNTTIREIQSIFSKRYPYLLINFYKSSLLQPDVVCMDPLSGSTRIKDICGACVSSILEIRFWNTINCIEKRITKDLGLSIQIFQKKEDQYFRLPNCEKLSLQELEDIARKGSMVICHSDANNYSLQKAS